MKFLRTIRFDGSDERIFPVAAVPDEWAVPGGFAFANLPPQEISGKTRQAFANGFLGLGTFGRSTFATVCEIADDDLADIEARLAAHFVADYGAPDMAAALPVAKGEAAFTLELCDNVPINTVFTLRRLHDEAGEIREEFRTIMPPSGEPAHTKIWSVVDDDA